MAYTNFTNCTEQEYLDIIYSQDDKNRIRIWFNNVELEDAGEYCESLSGTNRILPDDGKKAFSLGNFISKEYDLILRDLPQNTVIQDQVKISIGTLVDESNDTYEDVPLGVFNIQDTPTTDKNKITIKLRDNRVKFDFPYNAKPLIDAQGGSATYSQILNDICTQAGVINDVATFSGMNIAVSIYNNAIKGSTYVAYIAEQAGAIPIITREGHLNFIYLNNLKTWRIPLSIVEKYEIGEPYSIERVVYESGTIKYETSNDETLETLYLDAANPYITSQLQVDAIFNIVQSFETDSATTGKILGNPAIDAYDLIEVYDDDDINEPTIFTILANNTYTFNGVHRNTFDTQIGKEQRTENVTINSGATFQKIVKSEIDNIEGTITNVVSDTQTVSAIVIGTYGLTEDTTYKADKNYYILNANNEYELYEDYTVGDTIPADTIYELTGSKIQELSNNYGKLDEKIDSVNSSTISDMQKYTDSAVKISKGEIELSFNTKYSDYTDMNDATNDRINEIQQYLKYIQSDNSVRLGMSTEDTELVLKNNKMAFYDKRSGEDVAYISESQLYITNAEILVQLILGNFAFIPRSNGSLGFRKVKQ